MRIATIGLFLLTSLFLMTSTPTLGQVRVGVSITVAPPALLTYEQPICPGDGYIWTPGYWAYGDDGYFWVPGTWVIAPEVGFLWTPGYWGWVNGGYIWNAGYWGPHVGFYGGIDYGFGYGGVGFEGGYWNGGHFFYNRDVSHVNASIVHNVYAKRVVDSGNHVAFNGGRGGTNARPTAEQESLARERHVGATSVQSAHERAARDDRSQYASANHGHPAVAATAKPGEFKGAGVVPARATVSERRPAERTTRTESTRESKLPAEHAAKPATRESRPPAAEHATRSESTRESKPPTVEHATRPAPKESKPPEEHARRPETSKESRSSSTEHATNPESVRDSKPTVEHTTKPESIRESKPAEHVTKPEPTRESRPAEEHAAQPEHHEAAPAMHQAAPREEGKPH